MKDVEGAAKVLRALKDMGIRIFIDDFGSGYSSLQRLKSLPIDGLKIDRFFVQHIVDDRTNAAIVMAVVAMARHLNLEVVAEGVETEAQLEYLRSGTLHLSGSLSCDRVQGFLFSKPLPAVGIASLFARHGLRVLPRAAS